MSYCFFDLNKAGEERDFCNYYFSKKLFTDEEVDKIKEIGDSTQTGEATTFSGDSTSARQGKVAWVPRTEENRWIYDRLFTIVKEANDNIWKFELIGFLEDCQYTTYEGSKEKGDRYDFHLDLDGVQGIHRKISAVLQLTDESEYVGGDLEILCRNSSIIAPKEKGTITLFPSFLLHRVKEVIKGKRNSLVIWVSGYPFK